jgi:aspartyl-tRNA(Asn)/glutamyl-tRNA(Gln) amidotransferase subunit B
MLKGSSTLGQKVEVKNMNSIRNVQRAISYEIKRQIDFIEKGDEILHETRSFDAVNETTFSMRSKEEANDYRFFTEPDLKPVIVAKEYIEQIKLILPPLPSELFYKYTSEFSLSEYDANILTDTKEIALFFEEITKYTSNYKAAANWVMGELKSYLNENSVHINDFKVSAERIAELITLIDDGIISNSIASQRVFPELVKNPEKTPKQIADELNLKQESGSEVIIEYINQVIANYPAKVTEYKGGNKNLLGLFMGEVMKLSKGKADPKIASQMIKEILEK